MKANSLYIFTFLIITLTGLLLSPLTALAQDENDPSQNEYKDLNQTVPGSELIVNDDRSFGRNSDSTRVRFSSGSSQKVKSTDVSKPSSAKEDDALSFNFLYYIIQKFKISDLVDDE